MSSFQFVLCRGIVWGDDSFALVYESWYKTRKTRTWIISPEIKQEAHILFDRSSEDAYSNPGSPMLRRTSLGTYVLAWVRKNDGKKYLLLNGNGATPEGDIPFLDLLDPYVPSSSAIFFLSEIFLGTF